MTFNPPDNICIYCKNVRQEKAGQGFHEVWFQLSSTHIMMPISQSVCQSVIRFFNWRWWWVAAVAAVIAIYFRACFAFWAGLKGRTHLSIYTVLIWIDAHALVDAHPLLCQAVGSQIRVKLMTLFQKCMDQSLYSQLFCSLMMYLW